MKPPVKIESSECFAPWSVQLKPWHARNRNLNHENTKNENVFGPLGRPCAPENLETPLGVHVLDDET